MAGAGIVEPANEASGTSAVSIGSQVAGLVVRVPVRIGEEVKAGDLLVELDKRQAEAQLAVNQAQVSVAQATERQAADAYRRDLATTREAVSDQQRIADEEAWRLAQAQKKVADAAVRQAQPRWTYWRSGRRRPARSFRSTCAPASTSPSWAARAWS